MTALDSLWILLEASLKAAVLLGSAALLALALRRGSARLRHAVWSAALGVSLLLPFAQAWTPRFLRLELLPLSEPPAAAAVEASGGPHFAVASTPRSVSPEAATVEVEVPTDPLISAVPPRRLSHDGFLLGLWLLGALAVAGRLLWGLVRVARLAGRSRAFPPDPPPGCRTPSAEAWPELLRELTARLKLRRDVRLLESPGISTPMTAGVLRPAVFVPPQAAGWSCERRRVVLLHELVHVARGDAFVQVLTELCCALYWWNPLVWFARRRLHVEREAACDETVIALGTRPSDYATHLLEIASSLTGEGARAALPVAALTMIQRSQLEGRLMSILTAKPQRRSTALTCLATVAMTSLILVVTAADLRGAPPEVSETTWIRGEHNVHVERGFGGLDFYARIQGEVRFADDGSIEHLAPGSSLVLESSWKGVEPRVRITPGAGGEPRYAYTAGDEQRPFDDDARAWTHGMLAALHDVMETSKRRGHISSLRGKISHLHGQASHLRGKISHVHGERSHLNGRISQIRGEQSHLRGKISQVHGQVSQMRGEISRIRGEESRLKGELSHIRADLTALRQMERFEGEMTGQEKASHEERVSRRKDQLREIEERIARHDTEGKVAEIEARIREFDAEGKIAQISSEMEGPDVEGRIAKIEQEVAELDVEGRVAEIEADIEALDVSGKVAELERRIEEAEKELEPYEGRVESHSEELQRLTSGLQG